MQFGRVLGTLVIVMITWFLFVDAVSYFSFLLGLIVAIFVNIFFAKSINRYIPSNVLSNLFVGLLYLPLFLLEVFKASFRLAYYVLQPNPVLEPGIVAIPYSLENPVAITMLSVMITLTPGTLALDLDPDNRVIYIHWFHMSTQKEDKIKEESIVDLEIWARRIFE
jgi:multicomponent Na+:H+ antiporter subunit E